MNPDLFKLLPVFFWLLLFFYLAKIPLAIEAFRKQTATSNCQSLLMPPAVSVIIPARNEEKNLGFLLDSLAKQTLKPAEIIVVDDNSSDSTSQLVLNRGVHLVKLGPLPEGWTGKAYACFEGARAASGQVLLFLDADTRLADNGLEVLLGLYLSQQGFVSVQPYHIMEKPYEKLSAFFNLILILNMNISSYISRLNRPRGAFGPCLVCSKGDYLSVGGHEAIKGDIIDDMALARVALSKGLQVHCYAGKGLVSFRMYPGGLKKLVEGWTKNFATGATRTSPVLFLVSFGWLAGALSGPLDVAKGIVSGNDFLWQLGLGLYLIFALQVYYFLRKLGNFGVLSAIMYPLNLIFFMLIFMNSLFYTHLLGFVHWKGRKIRTRKN
ncbi:MAG: glycosyltransferase [Candidatus Saccharicenans sp.]|nr:glycosyltransferase [Candidatus Saccharicenans sp.]